MDVTDGVTCDASQLEPWQLLKEDMSMFAESKPHVSRSKAGRPHSSPVRIPTKSQHPRRRFHETTSTARARSQQEIGSSECSLKDSPFVGAGEKILSQRPPASAGMAYYANRPPIMPMHIVVVKQNLELNHVTPVSIAVTTSTDLCMSNKPDVATSTDLKQYFQSSPSSGEYLVRCMLRDLMTTLPLRLISSPASQTRTSSPDNFTTDSLRVRSPRSRARSPPVPALLQRTSPSHSVRSRGIGSSPPASRRLNYATFDHLRMRSPQSRARSPPVPALLQRTSPSHSVRSRGIGSSPPASRRLNYATFDQKSVTTHTVSGVLLYPEKGEGTQQEDWMGGVRALRDSHVRLVLRQLRHIDRLNRALDRFTKVSGKR